MKRQVIALADHRISCSTELYDCLGAAGISVIRRDVRDAQRGTACGDCSDSDSAQSAPLAVVYEVNSEAGLDELAVVIECVRSTWPDVPIVACRREAHGRLAPRTTSPGSEQLRRIGFRAVADSPAQLPALLRHVETALGTGELKLPEGFKSIPESSAFSLPLSVRGKNLRGAFALVVSLNLASDQKEAAQAALAGVTRLVTADRWSIFLAAPAGTDQSKVTPLAMRTSSAADGPSFDEEWWQELFADPAPPAATQTKATREAIAKIEAVKKVERGCRTVAVPLISGERVLGVLEGIRNSPDSRSFSRSEISLLGTLSISIAAALANSVRIAEAERLSLTDELTRLYNARYLRQFLVNEIKRARRYGSSVAAVFLDLDDFKRVNDLHGHLAGSHVLMEVAALTLPSVRDTDCVVRYGGDEFLIVLPDARLDDATQVAERIRAKIEGQTFNGGRRLKISLTASLGVAAFPQHALSPQQLITSADRAMYQAKAANKNCVRIASGTSATDPPASTDSNLSVPTQFQRIPDEKPIS
jgi:diguanylate cyclase (GGDEF)-like protein